MNKIMILYASVGGGHYKAASGINNYINENYPNCKTELVDALKYTNKLVDKLVVNSYVNMARYSPKVWGDIYKISEKQYSVANFSNAVQKLLSKKLFKLFKDEQPDVVISTHPFITEMVAALKKCGKTNTRLCVVMTDYASHKFWEIKHEYVDMYFVANSEMKFGLVANGISETKIHVTGIPVDPAFTREYNKEEIYNSFNLSNNKKTVLIFGGGQFGMSNIKNFFSSLLQVNADIQIIAVAGKSEKNQKEFKKLAENSNKNVVILGYTNQVPELMQIADFVISKPGGLTTTEILVSQVPFIIINPVPGQEEENANFLTNNGAATRIWDTKRALPFIEQFISDSFRIENMKIMQKHIARPNSTKNIVDTIVNTYLN